ncbi:MAG: hypothetical protein ACTSXU_01180 [Promethearchaeota archaeon]
MKAEPDLPISNSIVSSLTSISFRIRKHASLGVKTFSCSRSAKKRVLLTKTATYTSIKLDLS